MNPVIEVASVLCVVASHKLHGYFMREEAGAVGLTTAQIPA